MSFLLRQTLGVRLVVGSLSALLLALLSPTADADPIRPGPHVIRAVRGGVQRLETWDAAHGPEDAVAATAPHADYGHPGAIGAPPSPGRSAAPDAAADLAAPPVPQPTFIVRAVALTADAGHPPAPPSRSRPARAPPVR